MHSHVAGSQPGAGLMQRAGRFPRRGRERRQRMQCVCTALRGPGCRNCAVQDPGDLSRILWTLVEGVTGSGFESFCLPVALACWFHRAVPAHFKRDVPNLFIRGCCDVAHRDDVYAGNLDSLVDVGNGVVMAGHTLGSKRAHAHPAPAAHALIRGGLHACWLQHLTKSHHHKQSAPNGALQCT